MAHKLRFFKPTPEIVSFVAKHMRKADRAEVKAMSGRPPLDILLEGIDLSHECYALATPIKSIPCAILGIIPVQRGAVEVGAPWMLGTDDLIKHVMHFHRGALESLNKLNERWGVLTNLVDRRNIAHIRWLHHLGFKFGNPVIAGIEQRPFLSFSRTV
jgi:hypothetical protein